MWGSLHVTEQADTAYGLVPLTTLTLEESEANRLSMVKPPGFRTDIWLVGPEEFEHPLIPFPGTPIVSGASRTEQTDKGLEVTCSFEQRDVQIIHQFQDRIESGEAELPEDPSPHLLSQEAHRMVADALVNMVAKNVTAAAQHFLENDVSNMVLSRARKNFQIGLGGAAFVLAAELIVQGRVDTLGEVSISSLVVGSAMVAYHGIKKYLENLGEIRHGSSVIAEQYAQVVAYDIYRTYSASHFNQQAEEMFGPTPEDS